MEISQGNRIMIDVSSETLDCYASTDTSVVLGFKV